MTYDCKFSLSEHLILPAYTSKWPAIIHVLWCNLGEIFFFFGRKAVKICRLEIG